VVLLRGGRGGQYVSAICFGERHRLRGDRFGGSRRAPYACSDPAKGLSTDGHVVFRTAGLGTLGGVCALKLGSATPADLGSDSGADRWTAGSLRAQPALSTFRSNRAGHFARSGCYRDRGALLFSLDAGAGRLSVSRPPTVRGVEAVLRGCH